ncbi:hypothetical protein BJF79_05405 [Actinomadura sp. CNU-125]|uniref:hypothetical protein n=1 Tax=Actinomadura sp. CNU-125 TaxID=1904961 RepID=UPI00095B15EF|nr:hypothetical protein [Actinomadura sp. CNU-125]OLT38171.1 hypothetical protein BJF79_05405 [Actinomadura sp. CNU-125]
MSGILWVVGAGLVVAAPAILSLVYLGVRRGAMGRRRRRFAEERGWRFALWGDPEAILGRWRGDPFGRGGHHVRAVNAAQGAYGGRQWLVADVQHVVDVGDANVQTIDETLVVVRLPAALPQVLVRLEGPPEGAAAELGDGFTGGLRTLLQRGRGLRSTGMDDNRVLVEDAEAAFVLNGRVSDESLVEMLDAIGSLLDGIADGFWRDHGGPARLPALEDLRLEPDGPLRAPVAADGKDHTGETVVGCLLGIAGPATAVLGLVWCFDGDRRPLGIGLLVGGVAVVAITAAVGVALDDRRTAGRGGDARPGTEPEAAA